MSKDDLSKAERRWRKRTLFQKKQDPSGIFFGFAVIIAIIILVVTIMFTGFSPF
jgi:hypothetical protein